MTGKAVNFSVNNGEYCHMEARPEGTECEIHDWEGDDVPRRMINFLRERHGKGGVNICVECITRVRKIAAKNAGIEGW